MAKEKIYYECTSCGNTSTRWLGKCPRCNAWNTFEEHKDEPNVQKAVKNSIVPTGDKPSLLKDVEEVIAERIVLNNSELDRVLGGGIMPASVILLAGDPGIGKSTLLLQSLCQLTQLSYTVLYVSGEESKYQIKMRAVRLGVNQEKLLVMTETSLDKIMEVAEKLEPDFIAIDSIQTMYKVEHGSAPGSVPQIRECTSTLTRYAKSNACSVFLIGHVTKDGALAGPRVLEHMVDVVLYFEGDTQHEYRLLRAAKNRFGSVNELGVFQMTEKGMETVENPSVTLLNNRASNVSGSVVFCAMHGSRPILVDLQALSTKSFLNIPRRTVNGTDQSRVTLLLAVIEKRANKRLFDQDVYINVAGGLSISDPAADLALILAIVSSHENKVIPPNFTVMGEVGLCGEVRAITQAQRRINECERLGYTKIMLPKSLKGKVKSNTKDGKLIFVDTVSQALALAFE